MVKIIIDVTTDDTMSLWATNVRQPVAALTDAAITIWGMSGKTYGGRARKAASVTTITGRWDAIGSSPTSAPAIGGTAWQSLDVPLYGKYIVPPGGMFAVHASEVTATASAFRVLIRWHEIQTPYVSS